MALARSWILALCLPFASAGAQAPTIDSTAVAARAERLPAVDNEGNIIPESEITAKLRRRGISVTRTLLGALAGMLVFALITEPGPECVPWDPCSPREEWRSNTGVWFGMVVGGIVGAAASEGDVDRWRAIEIIRAERSRARRSSQ